MENTAALALLRRRRPRPNAGAARRRAGGHPDRHLLAVNLKPYPDAGAARRRAGGHPDRQLLAVQPDAIAVGHDRQPLQDGVQRRVVQPQRHGLQRGRDLGQPRARAAAGAPRRAGGAGGQAPPLPSAGGWPPLPAWVAARAHAPPASRLVLALALCLAAPEAVAQSSVAGPPSWQCLVSWTLQTPSRHSMQPRSPFPAPSGRPEPAGRRHLGRRITPAQRGELVCEVLVALNCARQLRGCAAAAEHSLRPPAARSSSPAPRGVIRLPR
jgi:hypothetical protein